MRLVGVGEAGEAGTGDVRPAGEGDDRQAHVKAVAGGGVAVVGEGIEGDVAGVVLFEVGQSWGAAGEDQAISGDVGLGKEIIDGLRSSG